VSYPDRIAPIANNITITTGPDIKAIMNIKNTPMILIIEFI